MPKIIETKSLVSGYANALVYVTRILPEVLPSGRGAWPLYQREAIAAAVENASPGLSLHVATRCAAGRGDAAIDLLSTAVSRLEHDDPFLFEKTPSREEAFALACEWMNENPSPVGSARRSYIFSNFADQMDSVRFANAYAQKHDLASRAAAKPRDFPTTERTLSVRSAPIDGSNLSQGDDLAHVTYELPGKIGGTLAPEVAP